MAIKVNFKISFKVLGLLKYKINLSIKINFNIPTIEIIEIFEIVVCSGEILEGLLLQKSHLFKNFNLINLRFLTSRSSAELFYSKIRLRQNLSIQNLFKRLLTFLNILINFCAVIAFL